MGRITKVGLCWRLPGFIHLLLESFSSTDLPTVIGWETHEAMWGRSWKEVEERVKDVNSIYTNGSRVLMGKYGVKYIFVRKVKKERHCSIGLKNCSWLRVAYRNDGIVVY